MHPTTRIRTKLDANQYQCKHDHNWALKSSLDAPGNLLGRIKRKLLQRKEGSQTTLFGIRNTGNSSHTQIAPLAPLNRTTRPFIAPLKTFKPAKSKRIHVIRATPEYIYRT